MLVTCYVIHSRELIYISVDIYNMYINHVLFIFENVSTDLYLVSYAILETFVNQIIGYNDYTII